MNMLSSQPNLLRVSIVIPCFNQARWLRESIESCLHQTYQPIEIIVVDDGSTDEGLQILQSFGQKIRVESGPNRGGNYARNRGFALSQGKYIQFLDADDYLLPEKIARQVTFLEETGADVVYGDWRHQFHEPDGHIWQDDTHISAEQPDVLASLLRGWWVANNAILWRREVVVDSGGWDKALNVGQDRDFFLAVAMTDADIRYQPGCHAIYRRYGPRTVSTGNRQQWLDNHQTILEKAEKRLKQVDKCLPLYRQALAHSYFHIARNHYERDTQRYQTLMQKVMVLDPAFKPQESRLYNAAWRLLGFGAAERLAALKRKIV